MALSAREKEVILLKAAYELINSAVNFEVLGLICSDPHSEIRFASSTHQRYFNIVLVDFLSRTDQKAVVPNTSYLEGLESICAAPGFDHDDSVKSLKAAVDDFATWLGQRVEVETWMPSIDAKAVLPVTRALFIRICGNISKHNFLRLARTAAELQKVLEDAGKNVGPDDALLALGDFYQRFHTDILNYHSSTIAEFLNNIRWGIYDYLQPEFTRSIVREAADPSRYRYTVPSDLRSGLATECYWELMNEVRSSPFMRRFAVTEWLKKRY